MPSVLVRTTTLTDVRRIDRRGIGPVYRASISLDNLYRFIRNGDIHYSPRYQRGFGKWADFTDDALNALLPITDTKLQIKNERALAMAIKYLDGRLYTSNIVWNARVDDETPEAEYNDDEHTLSIYGTITVPDTAHRHRAYYWLVHWKYHPEEIPDQVEVDGEVFVRDRIEPLLEDFDPFADHVHVDVYALESVKEGFLYDEFNADSKPPSTAVAIALNPRKTPSRRFVDDLMKHAVLLGPDQIETRGNTISVKSRKLTTISTLEASARNMVKSQQLAELERERPDAYKDLVEFVAAFFGEWAHHFPAFLPGKTHQERWAFREESYAIANLMFHPLMKLAFDLWQDMDANDEEWRHEHEWKDAIARLAGTVEIAKEQEEGGALEKIRVPIMSKLNPKWENLILVPRFDRHGNQTGVVISNTRQTRDAAYSYIREVSKV